MSYGSSDVFLAHGDPPELFWYNASMFLQAIPLPPQLQLVAFPATSEDGTTPLWAPRPPLLVTTEAGPRGLRTSPSPRQDQKGAPLLQQLLDSSKSWTMHTNNRGSPQVSYSADVSINTDSLPTGDLDSALDATPLECPLCQLKFNSVADLDAHERLHQVHSDTGDLFQEVLQKHVGFCQVVECLSLSSQTS